MLRIYNRKEHQEIINKISERALHNLNQKLVYLLTYGEEEEAYADSVALVSVHLFPNSIEISYGIRWDQYNKITKSYDYWLSGGLIYDHNSETWSVHT